MNYLIVRALAAVSSLRWKKVFLVLGVAVNLVWLAAAKWLGMILPLVTALEDSPHLSQIAKWINFAGVSFVVFSAITVLVDVYRKQAEAPSPHQLFNYLFFFPKVISGPIVRFKDYRHVDIVLDDIILGVKQIIIGLSQKLLIADILGELVNSVFYYATTDASMDRASYWIGMFAYTFQIYFDFAGYSNIAIGVSRMLGVPISPNFNNPYLSGSVSEFWRRWHISLGEWFKNYVYIPLGGSRTGNVYLNLIIVFLLTGIWHGATFNFVIWGAVFAVVVVVERMFKRIPALSQFRLRGVASWFLMFSVVCLNWVLFRTKNLSDAKNYYLGLFWRSPNNPDYVWQYFLDNRALFVLVVAALFTFVIPFTRISSWWDKPNPTIVTFAVRTLILVVLWVACFLQIINSDFAPFLYFQF